MPRLIRALRRPIIPVELDVVAQTAAVQRCGGALYTWDAVVGHMARMTLCTQGVNARAAEGIAFSP